MENELRGKEFHILGYWLDTASPALLSRLSGFQAVRTNRIRDIFKAKGVLAMD